jgi:hypothetical protein
MKVVATKVGFHDGSLVQPGTEFEVSADAKGSWFVPVGGAEGKAAKAAKDAKPKVQEPKALSELGKELGKAPTDPLA